MGAVVLSVAFEINNILQLCGRHVINNYIMLHGCFTCVPLIASFDFLNYP